ncbi:MAG: hypothetical protein NT167_16855, partial [Verrucomicrobia bacterium]|nr:hypothetical protein [Verrucomicrobiota bacterium]
MSSILAPATSDFCFLLFPRLLSAFYFLLFSHDGVGVRPDGDPVQPAVEVVAERARPQHAEAVLLVQGIDLDYNIAHRSKAEIRKAESRNRPNQKLPGEV